ncbi:MAG: rod shape-determining protein MreD [Nitriliruptorales bacterium]|nr:rod shape-determining protein MreD [Nitriliruptorales bacterium]
MIARSATVALVLITAAVLQTALFPHLTLAGFRPDLLLLATTAFALRDGPLTGLRVGFAAGLIADLLLNQSALGLTALVFLGVGYAVGTARPYFAHGSVTAPVLLAMMSGLLGTAGYGLFSRLLGDERFTLDLVVQASLFVALYNTLLAPIVIGLVERLGDRFPVEGAAAT